MSWDAELRLAEQAARAAGRILSERASQPLTVSHKGAVDLVTEVDLACERAIRELLAKHTPDIPVLGEEGEGGERDRTRWVVDPLDGTTNFVHGFPFYAVSVALEHDGRQVVGVLYEPLHDRLYQATLGGGATCAGQPMRVSDRRSLKECLVGTGFGYDRAVRPDHYLDPLRAVMVRCQGIRRAGAAALDLAMTAEGRLDAYFERNLKRWDLAGGILLVTEAGGRVSPLPDAIDGLDVVASNPWVFDELVDALASA